MNHTSNSASSTVVLGSTVVRGLALSAAANDGLHILTARTRDDAGTHDMRHLAIQQLVVIANNMIRIFCNGIQDSLQRDELLVRPSKAKPFAAAILLFLWARNHGIINFDLLSCLYYGLCPLPDGIGFFSTCRWPGDEHVSYSLGLALARGVRVWSLEPPSLKLLPHKLDIFSILLVKLPPSQVLHAFQTSSFFFNGSPFTVVRNVRCATVAPFEPPSLKLFSQHVHIFYFHLVKLPCLQVLHACLAISTALH